MADADNPLTLVCRKCGETNRLPCVHCRKCGAKLDFDAAEAAAKEEAAASRKRKGGAFRTVVAILFLAALGLALWPSELPHRAEGAQIDAKRAEMKRELLKVALEKGLPASQTFTEAEINAWLAQLPAMQEEKQGMAAQLLDTAVCFDTNRAQWLVLVKRGPFRFSAVFSAKASGSELALTEARLGHLPMPGALGRFYARTQKGLFAPFAKEAHILRNLDSLVIREGEMEVLTRATAPEGDKK
jgi:hypothetical protein